MTFYSWRRSRTSTQSPRGRAQHRPLAPRFRPRLEALEGRWVPSTLTVTNNLDSGPGSLRAEITGAQNNDTIVFSPQLYFATIPVTQGELFISKNLTIKGLGANFLTLDAHPRYQYLTSGRVFDVRPGVQVTLSGMTITDGQAGLSGGPL